jgi:hypothetical protein
MGSMNPMMQGWDSEQRTLFRALHAAFECMGMEYASRMSF